MTPGRGRSGFQIRPIETQSRSKPNDHRAYHIFSPAPFPSRKLQLGITYKLIIIIIIINNNEFAVAFPRGGSSSTVSRSNWNLEVLVFVEGGKPEYPEKNPRSRVENQQQTQPTYDTGYRNRTRATLVGGEHSHHCAIPAPRRETTRSGIANKPAVALFIRIIAQSPKTTR